MRFQKVQRRSPPISELTEQGQSDSLRAAQVIFQKHAESNYVPQEASPELIRSVSPRRPNNSWQRTHQLQSRDLNYNEKSSKGSSHTPPFRTSPMSYHMSTSGQAERRRVRNSVLSTPAIRQPNPAESKEAATTAAIIANLHLSESKNDKGEILLPQAEVLSPRLKDNESILLRKDNKSHRQKVCDTDSIHLQREHLLSRPKITEIGTYSSERDLSSENHKLSDNLSTLSLQNEYFGSNRTHQILEYPIQAHRLRNAVNDAKALLNDHSDVASQDSVESVRSASSALRMAQQKETLATPKPKVLKLPSSSGNVDKSRQSSVSSINTNRTKSPSDEENQKPVKQRTLVGRVPPPDQAKDDSKEEVMETEEEPVPISNQSTPSIYSSTSTASYSSDHNGLSSEYELANDEIDDDEVDAGISSDPIQDQANYYNSDFDRVPLDSQVKNNFEASSESLSTASNGISSSSMKPTLPSTSSPQGYQTSSQPIKTNATYERLNKIRGGNVTYEGTLPDLIPNHVRKSKMDKLKTKIFGSGSQRYPEPQISRSSVTENEEGRAVVKTNQTMRFKTTMRPDDDCDSVTDKYGNSRSDDFQDDDFQTNVRYSDDFDSDGYYYSSDSSTTYEKPRRHRSKIKRAMRPPRLPQYQPEVSHTHKHGFNEDMPWRSHQDVNFITQQERKRYEGMWVSNKYLYLGLLPWWASVMQGDSDISVDLPDDGLMLNLVVKDIWSRSELPNDLLIQIFGLVDTRKDGTLDRRSFVVGMWLVDQCLYGRKLRNVVDQKVWESADRYVVNSWNPSTMRSINKNKKKLIRKEIKNIKKVMKTTAHL